MIFINLGGLGGCRVTDIMINLGIKKETYPYDWIFSNQNFVIDSILSNGSNFFIFEDSYVVSTQHLISPNKNAALVHDFYGDFNEKKDIIINKYKRRIDRLFNAINTQEEILFIRDIVDTPEHRLPYFEKVDVPGYQIESDDIIKWDAFITKINEKNYNCKLLLLSRNNNLKSNSPNIEIFNYVHNNFDDVNKFIKDKYL